MENSEDINQNQEAKNEETQVEISVSAPRPMDNDDYNQIIATLAFNSLSDEQTMFLTGMSKENPDFLEKIEQNKDIANRLIEHQSDFICQYLNKIDNFALNGKINKAYTMLVEIADFSEDDYIFMNESGTSPLNYLETRFENIEEISNQLDFLERVNIINSGQEIKNPSMFCKRLVEYEDNLELEQKAKLNMLCAQTFKGSLVTVQGTLLAPAVADYKSYLEKAINQSSDYNIIADCHSGIEALGQIKNNRIFKDAYRKVLDKAKKEKDNRNIYNASKKLAGFYKEEYNAIGYKTENSPQFKSLLKSERYYIDAIDAYKKENKSYNNSDLRELASIQSAIPNNDGWISTKTKIANSLKGTDKYKVLISILPKMKKNQMEYINMLSTNVSKSNIALHDKFELLSLLEDNIKNTFIRDERNAAQECVKKARDYINNKRTAPTKNKER